MPYQAHASLKMPYPVRRLFTGLTPMQDLRWRGIMLNYIFMGSPPLAATILERLCTDIQPPAAVVTQLAKAAGRGRHVQETAVEYTARKMGLNVLSSLDVNLP